MFRGGSPGGASGGRSSRRATGARAAPGGPFGCLVGPVDAEAVVAVQAGRPEGRGRAAWLSDSLAAFWRVLGGSPVSTSLPFLCHAHSRQSRLVRSENATSPELRDGLSWTIVAAAVMPAPEWRPLVLKEQHRQAQVRGLRIGTIGTL